MDARKDLDPGEEMTSAAKTKQEKKQELKAAKAEKKLQAKAVKAQKKQQRSQRVSFGLVLFALVFPLLAFIYWLGIRADAPKRAKGCLTAAIVSVSLRAAVSLAAFAVGAAVVTALLKFFWPLILVGVLALVALNALAFLGIVYVTVATIISIIVSICVSIAAFIALVLMAIGFLTPLLGI